MSVSAPGDAHPAHALELFRTVFPSSLPSAACHRTATCAHAPLSAGMPRGSRALSGRRGSKANSRDNAPRLGGWFGSHAGGTDGKFGLGDFFRSEAGDRLFHFNHNPSVSSPVKWGAILPAFFVLWEFSEFMPVKPSTNGIYYYLGTAPGETRASPQARSGKGLFKPLAPSSCPSCLWVSLSLSRPQFPCLYYGETRVPRDWKCQTGRANPAASAALGCVCV